MIERFLKILRNPQWKYFILLNLVFGVVFLLVLNIDFGTLEKSVLERCQWWCFFTLLALPLSLSFFFFRFSNLANHVVRSAALHFAAAILFLSVLFLFLVDNEQFSVSVPRACFYFDFSFLAGSDSGGVFRFLVFGCDSLSICFLLLTTFTILLCFLCSWELFPRYNVFCSLIFLLEFMLIATFTVMNAFAFYIFFESVLMPMFLIIGIWGSGESKKVRAAFYFFFFTLVGSASTLFALFYIAYRVHSLHMGLNPLSLELFGEMDLTLSGISLYLSDVEQTFLFLAVFISFAVKVPMFPFHLWLPEAHVEAPTAGSVLLAGVLLKLGGYGLLRFIYLLPTGAMALKSIISLLALLSITYATYNIFVQVDLKKIIAYSSIAHMNYVVLGIFSLNPDSFVASVFLMLSHGVVSSALFICVGLLYDRYKTRVLYHYGGLITSMPIFSAFFFLFCIANCAIPGSSSFIGEYTVLVGVFYDNWFVGFVGAIAAIFSGIYSIWFFNRIFMYKSKFVRLGASDVNGREFLLLLALLGWILSLGFFPNVFFDLMSGFLLPYTL